MTIRLLDLFAGAGGSAAGYHEAGFDEIVGIDIVDQPRYPFTFIQGDALEYVRQHGHEYDLVHASPPCQHYNSLSKVNGKLHGKTYPDLIAATRSALQATGKPYVIENVIGARRQLINPVMLCGTFFGLKVYRHRLFECSPSLAHLQPHHVPHDDRSPGCNGNRTSPKGFITVCGGKGGGFRLEPASKAMGIDWMIRKELALAIPPAYTRWIGKHMMEAVRSLHPTEADAGREVYVDAIEKRGIFKGGIHERIILGTPTIFGIVKFPDCQSVSIFPLEEIELVPETEKVTATTVAQSNSTQGKYTMLTLQKSGRIENLATEIASQEAKLGQVQKVYDEDVAEFKKRKLTKSSQEWKSADRAFDLTTRKIKSLIEKLKFCLSLPSLVSHNDYGHGQLQGFLIDERGVVMASVDFEGRGVMDVAPHFLKVAVSDEDPSQQSTQNFLERNTDETSVEIEVIEVLMCATVEGNTIKLNSPQLDRKLYLKVNEALERIGGKWKGGKVSAHVFDSDPTDALHFLVDSGSLPDKNPLAFFATPDDLALRIAGMLSPENVVDGVLEPSAGKGALALAVRSIYSDAQVDCVEIDSSRAKHLKSLGFNVHEGDFLSYEPGRKYRAIVMNPPFSTKEDKLAYVTHIEKAFSLLDNGGELIAIAPSGLTFNSQNRVQEFRILVQEHGDWEELEDGAFKSSGTGVRTVLVNMKKVEARKIPDEQHQTEISELIQRTEVEIVGSSDEDECDRICAEINELGAKFEFEVGRRLLRLTEIFKPSAEYPTLDSYCRAKLNQKFSETKRKELVHAAKVMQALPEAPITSLRQTKPLYKMLNAGVEPGVIEEIVGVAMTTPSGLTGDSIETVAVERGLLPKKEPKQVKSVKQETAEQGRSLGLPGSESQQLPDIDPNADVPPEQLVASLAECITWLEVNDFIRARQSDAIAQFVAMDWDERFELRQLTQGTIDNQLMGNATEAQRRQVIPLLDLDKNSKIEWLSAELVRLQRENEALRRQLGQWEVVA